MGRNLTIRLYFFLNNNNLEFHMNIEIIMALV